LDGKYERTFLKKANVPIDGQPYSIYLHHRRKALGEARNGLKVLLQLRGLGQGAKNIAQISAFFYVLAFSADYERILTNPCLKYYPLFGVEIPISDPSRSVGIIKLRRPEEEKSGAIRQVRRTIH